MNTLYTKETNRTKYKSAVSDWFMLSRLLTLASVSVSLYQKQVLIVIRDVWLDYTDCFYALTYLYNFFPPNPSQNFADLVKFIPLNHPLCSTRWKPNRIHILTVHFYSVKDVFSEHLMFACVPVMQQSSRNKEKVVLMAALAIIPSTVAANLGLASWQTHRSLTSCGGSNNTKTLQIYTEIKR